MSSRPNSSRTRTLVADSRPRAEVLSLSMRMAECRFSRRREIQRSTRFPPSDWNRSGSCSPDCHCAPRNRSEADHEGGRQALLRLPRRAPRAPRWSRLRTFDQWSGDLSSRRGHGSTDLVLLDSVRSQLVPVARSTSRCVTPSNSLAASVTLVAQLPQVMPPTVRWCCGSWRGCFLPIWRALMAAVHVVRPVGGGPATLGRTTYRCVEPVVQGLPDLGSFALVAACIPWLSVQEVAAVVTDCLGEVPVAGPPCSTNLCVNSCPPTVPGDPGDSARWGRLARCALRRVPRYCSRLYGEKGGVRRLPAGLELDEP